MPQSLASILIHLIFGTKNTRARFRAFSAEMDFVIWILGRCPRLLHFAPSALGSRVGRKTAG